MDKRDKKRNYIISTHKLILRLISGYPIMRNFSDTHGMFKNTSIRISIILIYPMMFIY